LLHRTAFAIATHIPGFAQPQYHSLIRYPLDELGIVPAASPRVGTSNLYDFDLPTTTI
jgi:hypothetical protein